MENINSVAYVAKIDKIQPITGADNIEQAIIGGWSCIVKKGAHSIGELVICATTDATIPRELSESMGIVNYLRDGKRVRTVKLRGTYSECLIIPTSYVNGRSSQNLKVGEDMMSVLGITKYEPAPTQIQLSGGRTIQYRSNPNFNKYYKFPNIKNVKGMFTEEDSVEMTRKLHGTNARYGIVRKTKLSFVDRIKKFFGNKWVGYEFVVGSHNIEKASDTNGIPETNVWTQVAKQFGIKEKLWDYVKNHVRIDNIGSGVVLYGEIYGAGIQKNYDYGLSRIEFAAFDITINGNYINAMTAERDVTQKIILPYVPVLYIGPWSQKIQDSFVLNNFIGNSKVPHEGIVIKHISGKREKVAKVINPDYLIYGEKHDVGDSH